MPSLYKRAAYEQREKKGKGKKKGIKGYGGRYGWNGRGLRGEEGGEGGDGWRVEESGGVDYDGLRLYLLQHPTSLQATFTMTHSRRTF